MVEAHVPGAEIASAILGTAFVIDASKGYLATAGHILKPHRASQLRVRSVYNSDGDYALGTVITPSNVFIHSHNDIAILELHEHGTRGRGLPVHDGEAVVGDAIAMIGFAGGTELTYCDEILGAGSPKSPTPLAFFGHVSARIPDDVRPVEVLAYDITTTSGNSGAPVFSLESGSLVALHVRSADGRVGYGLPVGACQRVADEVAAGTIVPRQIRTTDESEQINEYIEFEKQAAAALAGTDGLPDEPEKIDVQSALMALLGVDEPTSLLDWDWSKAGLSEVVAAARAFVVPPPVLLASVELAETVIPPGIIRKLEEVRLKARGDIWDIHQNDADPFPSDPHAHNVESGHKLDLGNGDLYRRTTRVGKIKKKDLLRIRGLAQEKGVQLPALQL